MDQWSRQDFSADECINLTLDDLDPLAVENFRQLWIGKARKAGEINLSDRLSSATNEQLLVDIEATRNGKLTYAALILFGTSEAVGRFLAQAEVVFEYRSSDASGPAQERQEFRRGFFGRDGGILAICLAEPPASLLVRHRR